MSRRVELPDAWRATLEELFGESVRDVQIFEHSRRLRLHGRAVATTRRGRIYLRGSAEQFFRDPALVLHEYFHVLRQWKPRHLTSARYVAELLRRGYWDNRFEIEAREFVEDHVHRFKALLSRHGAGDATRGADGPVVARIDLRRRRPG
jgi:hypothetical protein